MASAISQESRLQVDDYLTKLFCNSSETRRSLDDSYGVATGKGGYDMM